MKEKKKHRNKKFIILGVLVFILVLGVSYAWMHLVLKSGKNVHVSLGVADVVLVEESEKLELTSQIPVPDRIGKQGEEFKFYIENRSLMDVTYEIRLADNEEKHADCEECKYLQEKDIRYELKRVGLDKTETLMPDRKIDEGNLKKGKKIEYTLKIWINKEAVEEDIDQAVFYGKLALKATQAPNSEDIIEPTPDESGANVPELGNTLIPVVYDEKESQWKKADVETEKAWYDYEQQKWANAVIVTPETYITYQKATEGTIVDMDHILQMYVWIPRYSYTIQGQYGKGSTVAATPGEIDVHFIDKNTKEEGTATYSGDSPSGWYTPDAFTLGGKNLSGIWVGKFETGYKDADTTSAAEQNKSEPQSVIIKPGVYSWRGITVSNIYSTVKGIAGNDTFGLDGIMYDSHAMKNDEWGAAAYLSQSKYGKYGNEDYKGANKEVYINNNSSYQTGYSGGEPSLSSSAPCIPYNDLESAGDGAGQKGPGASTTGNIYGVYDMSGGAWEYVMGNYSNTPGISGFTGDWDTQYKDYINFYTSTVVKSHALSETAGWHGDGKNMVYSSSPWFGRGGSYSYVASAGVFFFWNGNGGSNHDRSFRVVLTLK